MGDICKNFNVAFTDFYYQLKDLFDQVESKEIDTYKNNPTDFFNGKDEDLNSQEVNVA